MFERKADNTEDTVFARKMVVHSLKMELQKQYSRGCMDLAYQMACLEDASPDTYLNKMKRVGEFADHLVLQMLASILQHDIIIVNVHPDTSLPTIRVPGGEFGSGESAGGPPIYVAFYEERKFINGHYQAVEPRPDSTTTFPELGILIFVFQGLLYLAPLAVSLPSRTASFRPEANSTVATSSQKRRRSASPDVSSAKRRNISSSSEISPARPKPKAAVELTPPPDSPSTPASLSGLRRMVRDDHGVSWTDYEVRKLFTLNHICHTYNILVLPAATRKSKVPRGRGEKRGPGRPPKKRGRGGRGRANPLSALKHALRRSMSRS